MGSLQEQANIIADNRASEIDWILRPAADRPEGDLRLDIKGSRRFSPTRFIIGTHVFLIGLALLSLSLAQGSISKKSHSVVYSMRRFAGIENSEIIRSLSFPLGVYPR